MIYKLSFKNKEHWEEIKLTLLDEEGCLPPFVSIREVGHIPIPEVLDENGKVITEAGFHEDYAIDIDSPIELNLKEFEITGKKWYHNFDGHGV